MQVSEITDRDTWDSFVLGAAPNTFLHSWEWGEVQASSGEGAQRLGVYDGESLYAVALLLLVKARRGWHYLVPHGPLTSSGETDAQSVTSLVQHVKAGRDKNAVAVRVAPLAEPSGGLRAALKDTGFRPAPTHVHAERTWVLDIAKKEETLVDEMRKTTRHAIRKAESVGVITSVITNPDEIVSRFWPLYEQTRERHGFVLWSRKMIEAQLQVFGQHDRIFAVVAEYGGRDVAAAICVLYGDTVFYYHGASTKLDSKVPAAQLLQWSAIKEAKRRGAAHYNFWGIAPENAPDSHPFHGITTFKQGFGGYDINYTHAQDLPLSFGYWKLWAIDSYRHWRRGF